MKKTTRVTALLLVVVMLMQTFAFAAQISDFSDFPVNSWSTEAMTAAVDNGLLIGMGNNRIEPKRLLTRAEMAATVTRAFGATVEKDTSFFEDVKESDWYSSVVSKAYNMQVMQGTGDTTFAPKNNISREEVFLSLARVLHIDSEEYSILDKFSDKADVADWSKNAVTGMVGVEYLNGYEDGTLRPKGKITREELAQVFHNIFKTYISEPGTYNVVAPEGSVIIRAPGVTLENVTINGDLVLADGIGAGNCNLKNVTVNGRIIVRGGEGTVDFENVKSTGKVIINDVNGTVNFHNYRTDVPFKDNLLELTPATFLKPTGSGMGGGPGGPGGGGTTYFTIVFQNISGGEAGKAVVAKNSTIKNTSGQSVPAVSTLGIFEGHTFYGWGVLNDTIANIIAKHNIKTSDEVANMIITGAHTFVPLYIDNDTGIIKGGAFGANSNYHVNPEHTDSNHEVTKEALLESYSDEDKYPTKWKITEFTESGEISKELTTEELVDELNKLDPDVVVKIEVLEKANKIVITFHNTVKVTEVKVKVIPDIIIPAGKIPALEPINDGTYFYSPKGWFLDKDGQTEAIDFTKKTFSAATDVYGVYNPPELLGTLVIYYNDEDGDGTYEEFETKNYSEETYTFNDNKQHTTKTPTKKGNWAFIGWATSPENAEQQIVITYPYEVKKANNPNCLYAAFTSSIVTATFEAYENNPKATVKINYITGEVLEGTIPTFTTDDETKYFYGWKNKTTNEEKSVAEFASYISEYVKTNKTDVAFEAIFKDKTAVVFKNEDGSDYKTVYVIPGGKATAESYPGIADTEKKYVKYWSVDGTNEFDFDTEIGETTVTLVMAIGDRYPVTFKYVNASSAPALSSKTAYAIPGAFLESDRVPSVTGFTYNGYVYTFADWTLAATDSDADGINDEGIAFDFTTTKITPPTQYVFNALYTKEAADVVAQFIYGYDIDDDGTDDVRIHNTSVDGSVVAPAEKPEKEADHQYTYDFAGWSLKENGIETDVVDFATYKVKAADVVKEGEYNVVKFYPVFTKEDVVYTIILTVETPEDFRAKDADAYKAWVDVEKTTTYGGSVTLPGASSDEIPVRPGTTFKYWYNENGTKITTSGYKVEPPLPTDGTLPATTITLYAYMECAVEFVDEVANHKETVLVQYGNVLPSYPTWARVEKGFERNTSIAAQYTEEFLTSEGMEAVHEIEHTWFNEDDFGDWAENAWATEDEQWVDFDVTLPIKSDETVYLSTRRLNGEADIDIDKFSAIDTIKLTVPYEKDSRVLTTVKDAIFMNETFVTTAFNQSGVEDKLLTKLRNKHLMAMNSREILNVNKTIEFVKVIGEDNLNRLIDEYLKKYFESDEAAQTLNEFLTKYLTNVNASNEKEVAAKLGELVNGMLKNDKDGTILTLEKAAHNIAENDLSALSDVIKAYVDSSLTTDAGTKELKKLLNEAFIKYCADHEPDFREFLKTIVNDLLIVHPDQNMIDLVTVLAIDKVKAGQFKEEIKAEIEKMDDEKLAALIVSFVKNDFAFVEEGLKSALDDSNFVINMIELLAGEDGAFRTKIKEMAEETLATGGNDLKEKLKDMFLEDLTPEQQEEYINTYINNLSDPAKIRSLALQHIGEITNDEILSYIQGDNPKIVISASDLITYINQYQDQIPDSTILAKIKEENSPIKVPSDTLLTLVKNGTITIPEETVLALVKTELLSMTDAQIASYIKDGTIPVNDSFITGIITDEINAQRDSLVTEAIQEAKDSGDYDLAVQALMLTEGLTEDEAKAQVEKKIADEVDAEIANKIAEETTPEKIAYAKENITEAQVNQYRDDIEDEINAIQYSSIESYANNYIQNSLTTQDIEDNYDTLVAQLDETTFESMKTNVLAALDETTVENNKTAFLSLVTAELVGNVKTTVITNASDADILKIKDSIAGILKKDGSIRETVINNYLDEAFASDDLGENLDSLLSDPSGRQLIARVISEYITTNGDAKGTLVNEVITTLKTDIANNGTMIDKAINAYITDATRKASLIEKAIAMLSTKDTNDKYILDNKTGLVYKEIYNAVQEIITDEQRCTPIIEAYVGSVIDVDVAAGEKVDFTEIIDIFCEGSKKFRDGVIDRFIVNLEKLPDNDGDGIKDGVKIIEEMIDAILEKMGKQGHVDEEIILVVLDYIVKHHEDEHGQELIDMLVKTIISMDNILEFAKELGYNAVNENLAEVDKFKEQITTEEQFEVTATNKFIIDELYKLALSLDFDSIVDKYVKPRLPEKAFNELPLDIARPIYERSHSDYCMQLKNALDKAEISEVGYVNSGVTINFNPVYEIYVPIYDYALEEYEKACGVADGNSGRPGEYYDKYIKDNPYIDDLIELLNTDKIFTEVSSNHSYMEVGSGYAVKSFTDYYKLVKSASVLLDDMFLWYTENVDYQDIENVLLKAEQRVLNYTNLLVSLANTYANDGIPDDIGDIYDDILADAIAKGDFEKIVGKVEGVTRKDVEYYIDKVLANRYPELAYDKVMGRVGARAATILELYIDSKFNRYLTEEDYDRAMEFFEFAYEDQNANITVDYVFDKVIDGDSKEVEFRGNTAEITRTVAATNSK